MLSPENCSKYLFYSVQKSNLFVYLKATDKTEVVPSFFSIQHCFRGLSQYNYPRDNK